MYKLCIVLMCVAANLLGAEAAAPGEKEFEQLISELGAEDFNTREKSQKKLADAGKAAVPALKAVLEKATDPEIKTRVQTLLRNEGFTVLPSGLKYKVLVAGTGGDPPKATDQVKTHYVGTLLDGTEFDNSRKRGEPATFPLNGVIKGWTEALQLMNVGSKWLVHIPPELAYGEQGAGGIVPPNATLVFEIELIAVEGR
jgi:FKBP-type peptidyl-prolyl cis-trans isomerase FklB